MTIASPITVLKPTNAPALPPGWTMTTLGELGNYINGRGYSKAEWSRTGRPIIRIQDLTGSREAPNYYDGEVEEWNLVKPGDLLVSWAATLGAFIWRGPEGCLNQHIFRVESQIDKLFHYYAVQAILSELVSQTHGSGIVHITRGKFLNTTLPLPPLAEQRRIVAAIEQQFTRLDAGIAALKRAQATLKRYRAAVLKAAVEGALTAEWRAAHPTAEPASALLARILAEPRARWEADQRAKGKDPGKLRFLDPAVPDTAGLPVLPEGWAWATVEQLAASDRYALAIGPFGSNLKVSDYREVGVPLVFVRNIRSRTFTGSDIRYVTAEKAAELSAHKIAGGDILVTKMGDPPGDACLYPEHCPEAIITADCIKWRLSSLLPSREYFVNAINSQVVSVQILSITKGVAQQKVSLERFEGISVSLPPLAEQEQIVTEVERRLSVVAELETAVAANLTRAERLRQSILREAFAGRLVPQDPCDEPASVLLERIRRDREAADTSSRGRTVGSHEATAPQAPDDRPLGRPAQQQAELWPTDE